MSEYLTKPINISDLAAFLTERCEPSTTKVYLGCDSEKMKIGGKWFADYSLVAVVHVNGKEGCRIFGEVIRERDYDVNKKHPRMRLMNEAVKVADFYKRVEDTLFDFYQDALTTDRKGKVEMAFDRNIEIHLDINPNPEFNSSIVINEAVGYIKGMTNVVPFVKPEALASSFAADRYKEVLQFARKAAKGG